jgi:hypothetical protein
MKFNKWTLGLAAVGAVSLASAARADETKMSQVQTALSDTTISGYVDVAATWRPGSDQNASTLSPFGQAPNVPLYSFAKNDGFSLNAIDIAIDKPMDESPWASGYHVELMAGSDAVPAHNNFIGAAFGSAGFNAIRQAYIALRTPVGNSGIDWKVGVWDTIIGYESTSSPLDPNYTRSYGYTIEPTTHTGILGTYKVNDMLSVSAGIANTGNDNIGFGGLNATATYESQKTYLAAIAFTAPDSAGWLKGATLNAGVIDAIDSGANIGSMTWWYVGATIPTPATALKLGASFDYFDAHASAGAGETWAAALYASYQINDKASLNLRGEVANDDWGNLYAGFGSGARDQNEAITATLQYNLWANVISRAEFRWDHVEHGGAFGTAFQRSNDFMLALNLIYQF